MTDLTPVGLSEDGSTLILVSHRGVEFRVLVDQRLRAALRGDITRLGQLEKSMENTLRPRDIQTRIRAGASVEEVAAAAGTTVEKLLVFAGPVIAEREHVATLAQKASLRRRSSERATAARTLDEAAAIRLRAINVIPEDVAWDSWRREDGRWTVVAEYSHHGSIARAVFTYDAPGRYITAENEEAQLLTGELAEEPDAAEASKPEGETSPVLATVQSAPALPNSSIVLGRAAPSDLPLGDDAIELVRRPAAASASLSDIDAEPTEVLFEAPVAVPKPKPAAPEPTAPAAAEHASRKKARSSMPSWDEIMFGGKND